MERFLWCQESVFSDVTSPANTKHSSKPVIKFSKLPSRKNACDRLIPPSLTVSRDGHTEKTMLPFPSHWMGYDRGDSFPFDFEPNGIQFGSKSNVKLSPRSYSIQCERKWKHNFLIAWSAVPTAPIPSWNRSDKNISFSYRKTAVFNGKTLWFWHEKC